ncbi:hypothetical protein [Halalkalirubrum salinum]|uniref:hypothetical protein n=1 Tax=Halalkalirubrum salinum TaxID=2563889 RepID=UPI0010FAF8BC|nr:hypothetical protein [Halalkalirubrum salinum]
MERRKFVIGLGALAAGSSAAVGTGAFTSASTGDRSVDVNVANDSAGFTALVPGEKNGEYAEETDGTLELNFNGDADTPGYLDNDGEGVNEDSVYTFDDVFVIRPVNVGSADIWLTTEDLAGVQFYAEDDEEDRLEEALWETGGTKTSYNESVGGLSVGVKIIEDELDSEDVEGSVTIHVEEEPGSVRD